MRRTVRTAAVTANVATRTARKREAAGGGRQGAAGGWLDAAAQDMAEGIARHEEHIPRQALADWLKETERAVRPLELEPDAG